MKASTAATPLDPIKRRADVAWTPPSANTGSAVRLASAARRNGPMGRPADKLLLGNTAEMKTASHPAFSARRSAETSWTAPVINHDGLKRQRSRASGILRSGKCTPSAPTRSANSASRPISKHRPRALAISTRRKASSLASGRPKAR